MAGPADTKHSRNGWPPRPVWVYPLTTLFVWGIALVVFFRFFSAMKLIVLGLLVTLAVAAMLHPVVRRIPLKRGPSAMIVVGSFLLMTGGIIALLVWLLIDPIQQQIDQWPALQENLDQMLAYWSDVLGMRHPVTTEQLASQVLDLITGESLAEVVGMTTSIVATLAVIVAFIFIGSLYFLGEKPSRLVTPILKLMPPRRVDSAKGVICDLEPRLRWWLLGTLIGMSVIGMASGVGYLVIGLRFALPLALFAALAEAVPTIGPAVTLILSFLVAATQGPTQMIGVVVVYIIVQGLESYVLLPLVMRSAVHVPPVVTLFTIVFWGKIFGIAGVLLAVPIDLVIWSFLDHFVIRPNDRPDCQIV